ncbi:hypothetical protein AAU57_12555 [Nonlabens sp. YIK11]|uniref:glycosyltransferase n=1 Tax=Nonlabens sp. YIK11 TaxID=1453349 RepID=UPI0006DC4C55|nr:glycosyltransferase [Nonlabens sp. YIK11]KQC34069.1 hypothetical protein AAU57_12555 [Nonlabens sp. YIK11]
MKQSILVITSFLRLPLIDKNLHENDIFYKIEKNVMRRNDEISFNYLFLIPMIPFPLNLLKKRWRDYRYLERQFPFVNDGHNIYAFSLLIFPKVKWLNILMCRFSLWIKGRRLSTILKATKTTKLHAQNLEGDLAVASYVKKNHDIPYLVTKRGGEFLSEKTISQINNSEGLVVFNTNDKTKFSQICEQTVHVIPHAISPLFFNYESKDESDCDVLKFLVVARLLPSKNVDMVIKELANFEGVFIFDIYGTGPMESSIRSTIEDLEMNSKVFYKGRIENEKLPILLKDYDAFLMPSSPETFGIAYLEAMASRVPVLCSRDCGIAPFITDGYNGFLVDLENPQSLNKQLKLIIDSKDKLKLIGLRAQKLAEEFSWDKVSQMYIDLYKA